MAFTKIYRLALLYLILLVLIGCYWFYVIYVTSSETLEVDEPWSEILNCTNAVNLTTAVTATVPVEIEVTEEELHSTNCTSPDDPLSPHEHGWIVTSAIYGTFFLLWIGFSSLQYNLSVTRMESLESRGCMGRCLKFFWWSFHSCAGVTLLWLFSTCYTGVAEIVIITLLSLITVIISLYWARIMLGAELVGLIPIDDDDIIVPGLGVNGDPQAPAQGHEYWAIYLDDSEYEQDCKSRGV